MNSKMIGGMAAPMVGAIGAKYIIGAVAGGVIGSFFGPPWGTIIGIGIGMVVVGGSAFIGAKVGGYLDNRQTRKQGQQQSQAQKGEIEAKKIKLTYKIFREAKMKHHIGKGNLFKAHIKNAYSNLLANDKNNNSSHQLNNMTLTAKFNTKISSSINKVIAAVKRQNRNTLGFKNTNKRIPNLQEENAPIDTAYRNLGKTLFDLARSSNEVALEASNQPSRKASDDEEITVFNTPTLEKELGIKASTQDKNSNENVVTAISNDSRVMPGITLDQTQMPTEEAETKDSIQVSSSVYNFWYRAATRLLQKDVEELEAIDRSFRT